MAISGHRTEAVFERYKIDTDEPGRRGGPCTLSRELTEHSENSKHTEQRGYHGAIGRHLRRWHRGSRRDLGRPYGAPGRIFAVLYLHHRPLALEKIAAAEQEQHLGRHPRPGRVAPGKPHARRRLAEGPLR